MKLWFKPDNRGKLQADYEGKKIFLCNDPRCSICDLTEREKLKELAGHGFKLEVELWLVRRPSIFWLGPTFYRGHLVKIIEEEAIRVGEGIEYDISRTNAVFYRTPNGVVVVDPGSMGFNGGAFPLDQFVSGEKILAAIITHGHEDHRSQLGEVGIQTPVFMTRLTHELAEHHVSVQRDFRLEQMLKRARIIKPGDPIFLNNGLKIETFWLPHSIRETMGLIISGPRARAVHLSDFRLSGWDPATKAETIACLTEIAKDPVDVLSLTILNAHLEGFVPPETLVIDAITNIMAASRGRVIITCFSSNLERIRRISEIAKILGRPVAFYGNSMQFSQQLLKIKTEALTDNSVVFVTGCQAEEKSVLWRIAKRRDPPLELRAASDTLVSSARCIPGNEEELRRQGAELRSQVNRMIVNTGEVAQVGLKDLGVEEAPTHFSGHEYGGGLRLVLDIFQHPGFKVLAWPQTEPQFAHFKEIATSLGVEILPETQRSIEI